MKIYFACPSGLRRDKIINNYGSKLGACLTRDTVNHITARKMHWFYDNGAYGDWKNNRVFDTEKFINEMFRIESEIRFGKELTNDVDFSLLKKGQAKGYRLVEPDFVVIPDLPARGNQSLFFSRNWIDYLERRFPFYNYYLAVQDDMSFELVENDLKEKMYSGLFVGGTKKWKYETSEQWVELAHKYDIKCHIGGIGTPKDIRWSNMIGADSVDSGIAMLHPKYLPEILEIENTSLFWVV